ncbi:hypothetical protein NYA28ABAC_03381 [Salinicola sp. NYA28a]
MNLYPGVWTLADPETALAGACRPGFTSSNLEEK